MNGRVPPQRQWSSRHCSTFLFLACACHFADSLQLSQEASTPALRASLCHCGDQLASHSGQHTKKVEVLTTDPKLGAEVRQSPSTVAARIAQALHVAASHVRVLPWSWTPQEGLRTEDAAASPCAPCGEGNQTAAEGPDAPARIQLITRMSAGSEGSALVDMLRALPSQYESEIARLLGVPAAQVRVNPPALESDTSRHSLTNFAAEWLPSLTNTSMSNISNSTSGAPDPDSFNQAGLAFWSVTLWPPASRLQAQRLLAAGSAASDLHVAFQRLLPETLERVPGLDYPGFHGNGVPEAKLLPPGYTQAGAEALNITNVKVKEAEVMQQIHREEEERKALIATFAKVQEAAKLSYDIMQNGAVPAPILPPPGPVSKASNYAL
mmetsp:Transcript_43688/g.79722  ORF Transcript_43688/g.79722 Transcript_43688/m.79722 type:complete len:381 (+) Transcript_43688:137-1279(+)